MYRMIAAVSLLVGLAAGGLPAGAQAIHATGASFVTSAFLAGTQHPDGTREAGLALRIADGWKTYWRAPGEAGIPPSFDWSQSENLASVAVAWPRPEVFESFGFMTLGYADRVVLPLMLTPADPMRPIRLVLTASIGVCRDICVLEQVDLTGEFAPEASPSDAVRIAAARLAVPGDGRADGLLGAECRISGAGRDLKLTGAVRFEGRAPEALVIVEGTEHVWIHGMQTRVGADRLQVDAGITLSGEGIWIDRSQLRLTVLADSFAADIHGCPAPRG